MFGVINVLYNDTDRDLHQDYRQLAKHFNQSGLEYRTFVIDNSLSERRSLIPDGIGILAYSHFPENLGYARACNLLMAQAFEAGCDAVLTTNVDGFPLPGCVPNMLATLDRNERNALVEARQFPQEHPRSYEPETGVTDWVSGCCLLIGRRTYEKLGPLDEGMFLYCEDVDYSFRARLAGIQCVVSTDAHFYHRGPGTPFDRHRRRHHLMSSRYLAVKWRNPEAQRIMEDALVMEGFFGSFADLPPMRPDMRTYSGIHWNPNDRATFAPRRWHA